MALRQKYAWKELPEVALGRLGKPYFPGYPDVHFNISHSSGAVLVGGIRIGDGARIGAGAAVSTDVPPGATVVSQPARVLLAGESPAPPAEQGKEETRS